MILALALAAAPAKTEPAQDGTPISGTFQGLISADDYPPEAAKLGQEGSVVIRVTVDDKGAIADCEIIRSSGVPSLDTQTCRIAWQRAKFTPGTDKQGRPRGGSTTATITWRLAPSEPLPTQPWSRREIAEFDKDGKPVPCRVEQSRASPVPPSRSPPKCDQNLAGTLMLLRAANPDVSAFVLEQRFDIGPATGHAIGPDDIVVMRQIASMEVDALGKLKSCVISQRIGPDFTGDLCAFLSKSTYMPRPGRDAKPAPFKATYSYEAFAKVERPVRAAPSSSSRKR